MAATDQLQARAVAHRLAGLGCKLGAAQITFNATLIAQREAAEGRDLSQRPASGRRVQPAPHPHAANDHSPASSSRA